MRLCNISRAFLFTSLFSVSLFPQEPADQPSLTAVRADRPLRMTGLLDDPLWKTAPPVELAFEFQPGENTPAPERTSVQALYDEENLYLGFYCYDSHPENIRANLSDRDRIFADDYVIVVIDTYSDYQRGYELAINPFGIQGDLMMTAQSEDASFDMIWETKASIVEDGWVAEMKIPFKSLRFPDTQEQTWGLVLGRNLPRETRILTSWTPVDRNIPNLMTQGGVLVGLKDIHSSGSIELLPYVLGQEAGSLSNAKDPTSEFANGDIQGRIGTGLRYSPSSDLSVNLAINPDFSQVESDADQISVNTTFALHYSEKRPFFLESKELLQTPMYYSRSINNPLLAGRVVGKSGGLTYMYLGAYDRNSVFVIPGEDRSNTVRTSLTSLANIGRLRYNFEDETYVGGMVFTRDFSSGHNYVAGFDWRYKFWTNWYFRGEGFVSTTKELNDSDSSFFRSSRPLGTSGYSAGLDGERYTGQGVDIVLSHVGRSYGFDLVYDDFSPTYQTYNGLFSSVNYRVFWFNNRYTAYWDDGFIERLNLILSAGSRFNYEGQRKERVLQPNLNLRLIGQTNVSISYLLVNEELFNDVYLSKVQRWIFNASTRAWDALEIYVWGQAGKFIYRSSSPEIGDGHQLSLSFTVRPTTSLKVDVEYDRARLQSGLTGDELYDGYIARSVAVYQFTPEMFLRTILQYNSFGKTFNLYPLLSYKMNALTTFYAGCTNDFQDFSAPHGFTTIQRQFFIKLQYLFRS